MKIRLPFRIAGLVVVVLGAVVARAVAASLSSGSGEMQAILDLAKPLPVAPEARRSETMRANDDRAQQMRELGLKYLAAHPAGPDRARVVLALDARRPRFIQGFKAGFDEKPSADLVVYDRAAQEAWDKQLHAVLRGVRDDATAEPAQRLAATYAVLGEDVYEGKTLADFTRLQGEVDAFARAGGQAPQVRSLQSGIFYAGAMLGVAEFEKLLAEIARSPNEVASSGAKETLATLAQQKANIGKIKFTAADGRAVDINALRGKVVLVDFWATWCGPCIGEIPNVRANYEKYHAKGFEIIGIAFENAGLVDEAMLRRMRPGATPDTPEQIAAKLAKAKQKMVDFTAERGMTWPQHFDGKYWQNEFGQLFGIHSIPAMFLLDKEGNIVSTNARGEALEVALKKLL